MNGFPSRSLKCSGNKHRKEINFLQRLRIDPKKISNLLKKFNLNFKITI